MSWQCLRWIEPGFDCAVKLWFAGAAILGVRMLRNALALACGLLAVSFGVPAGAADQPSPAQTTRPFALKRTKFALKEGEVWATWEAATLFCGIGGKTDARWQADDLKLDEPRLAAVFNEELAKAGLKSSTPDNLFEDRAIADSLQVGALVRDMHAQICFDFVSHLPHDRHVYRDNMDMTVEWQIYDPVRREVLARLDTTVHSMKDHSADTVERVIIEGFRQSARALLAKPEFLQIAQGPAEPTEKPARPADRSTLLVALAKDARMALGDALGSVVTVLVEDGHGSGFLISPDGYLLTNHHVVGDTKVVRIRWSDGFETSGEVLRSDKRRDIALIKSSPHGRQAFYLRQTRLQPGDAVFAIGTPMDEKLQGTVTKGVVSAYRILEGLNVLQSDVSVNHGNSGGPLVDERGAVVGVTAWGIAPNDTSIGLNFFVPIGDALDFLAIKPAP